MFRCTASPVPGQGMGSICNLRSRHRSNVQDVLTADTRACTHTPDLMLILRSPMCGSLAMMETFLLTMFVYLFTMSSLHDHDGSPDVHADVEKDHIDRDSEPGSEDSDIKLSIRTPKSNSA